MKVIINEYIDKIEGFVSLPFTEQTKYLAYCYVKSTKDEFFTPSNIIGFFELASLDKPKNINDIFQKLSNRRKGHKIFLKKDAKRNFYSFERTVFKQLEEELGGESPARKISATLRKLIPKVQDKQESEFLEEAVTCLEVGSYRASIIMSWLLTINHLQNYILKNKLSEFNTALATQNLRLRQINILDDFSELKESKFIEICRSARIISNDIRKILEEKLGIRNTYAHPNDIKIFETKATSFTEDLVENIISKFI
ncbi:MAG: hypothetical protein OQK82_03645 [Candidatus Pacearchaeota archaeon]|nr:hypothetical protein [Candidatus Pacearchaeota archaeon]